MGVVHRPAPSCAPADLLFSLGICLHATCFPPRVMVPSLQRVSTVAH